METKRIIVDKKALEAVFNQLLGMKVSGKLTVDVANCIVTLNQVLQTAEEYKEEEKEDGTDDNTEVQSE